MQDCIFCKIVDKKIPAQILVEDKDTMAFQDINPQAPTHILVIPKKHAEGMDDLTEHEIGKLFKTVDNITQMNDLLAYRLVVNKGEAAGQSVPHVHIHILSGRAMEWPPG